MGFPKGGGEHPLCDILCRTGSDTPGREEASFIDFLIPRGPWTPPLLQRLRTYRLDEESFPPS